MPTGPELPSVSTLIGIASEYGIELTHEQADAYRTAMVPSIMSYRRVEEMTEPKLPVRHKRDSGWRPTEGDNPLNAWYWRCEIEGHPPVHSRGNASRSRTRSALLACQ